MSLDSAWPSLHDELDLAAALYGLRGRVMLDRWFDEQVARTEDLGFAREFSDHLDLPGVVSADYLHRRVTSSAGTLLGGIRFYGRDIGRPFIEIIAHSFTDLNRMRACVSQEWALFAPRFLRVRVLPGRLTGAGVLLDKSVYAAPYCDMRTADPNVWLAPFGKVETADVIVTEAYCRLDIDLARNIAPATATDLDEWHRRDQLRAIHTYEGVVGLLAVVPDAINWMDGDVMNEEVIAVEHRGHGYAAAGQAAWAAEPGRNMQRLLIGTIDRLNSASRKTAEAAGRKRVLDWVFVSLPRLSRDTRAA
jgi:hypothetical protein